MKVADILGWRCTIWGPFQGLGAADKWDYDSDPEVTPTCIPDSRDTHSDMEKPLEDPGPSLSIEVMEISDSQEDVEEVVENENTATDNFETPTPSLTIGQVLSQLPRKKNGIIMITFLLILFSSPS